MTNEDKATAEDTTTPATEASEPEAVATGEGSDEPAAEEAASSAESADAPSAAEDAAPSPEPTEAQATASAESDTSEPQSSETQSAETESEDAPAAEAAASAESSDAPETSSDAASEPASPEAPATGETAAAAPAAPPEPEPELTLEEIAKAHPEMVPAIAALEAGNTIGGKVIGWNKGGFHVSLDGVPAFCPKSQMEIGNPKRAHAYLDRELEFKVAEIRDNGKRIVVHRKALLRQQREETIQSLRDKVSSGEPVEGKVTSITDFGAFVDIGGVEGLVHLSQLSRQRVESPSDAVQVGQEVKVKVLKIEKGGDRISLSMKALEPDPWKTADETFGIGENFTGRVVRASDFGLFIDVGQGIEGLLHNSQLEIGKSLSDYPEGSELTGWVRDVDAGRRRLSLSLREVAKGNPWADIATKYEEGQEIEGQVEQVAKFGVFVLLEPGVSGLLPFSATKANPGMRPQRLYNAGETLKVQIASIDRGRKRISLALPGSKLEGTRADLKEYQQRENTSTAGMGAMAAAFAKLQQNG